MVGHYGVKELAAASFVNNLTMLLVVTGLGFSLGLTPLVSEAEGRADRKLAGALLRNGLKSNAVLAALVFIVMVVLYLNLDNMGQPEELLPLIKPYYIVVSVSILCTYFFNAFKQFTDGLTKTKVSMTVIIASNVMNIAGNYVLIYGKAGFPEMGLLGAGISTLAARIFTVAAMAGYVFFNKRMKEYVAGFRSKAESRGLLGKVTRLGIPIGLQMGMETASFSLSIIMVGWLGTIALASHQIMLTISQFTFMMFYGMGAAVAVRVSNYHGVGDVQNVRRTANAGFHLILLMAVVLLSIVFACRYSVAGWFTDSAEVAALVPALFLPFLVYQFGDGLQITFANALRGIADVKPMMLMAFVAYFIVSLPVGYLFAFVLDWGLVGIWTAFPFGLTTAGVLFWLRFRSQTRVCTPC